MACDHQRTRQRDEVRLEERDRVVVEMVGLFVEQQCGRLLDRAARRGRDRARCPADIVPSRRSGATPASPNPASTTSARRSASQASADSASWSADAYEAATASSSSRSPRSVASRWSSGDQRRAAASARSAGTNGVAWLEPELPVEPPDLARPPDELAVRRFGTAQTRSSLDLPASSSSTRPIRPSAATRRTPWSTRCRRRLRDLIRDHGVAGPRRGSEEKDRLTDGIDDHRTMLGGRHAGRMPRRGPGSMSDHTVHPACASVAPSATGFRAGGGSRRRVTGCPTRPWNDGRAVDLRFLAEDGGFEPPRACTQHAFQACAIGQLGESSAEQITGRSTDGTDPDRTDDGGRAQAPRG